MAVFCDLCSFAINSLGKKELVALLVLSSLCHVAVIILCLFLMVSWYDQQCVIGEFPGPAHLHFTYTLQLVISNNVAF